MGFRYIAKAFSQTARFWLALVTCHCLAAVQTAEAQLPPTPTNLAIQDISSVSQAILRLNWVTPAGGPISTFQIYRAVNSSQHPCDLPVYATTPNNSTFNDTNVARDSRNTYSYAVRTVGSGGSSACSNVATISPPSIAQVLRASQGEFPDRVNLSFNQDPHITRYDIYWSYYEPLGCDPQNPSHCYLFLAASGTPTFEDRSAADPSGTVINYRIHSCNVLGCSSFPSASAQGWRMTRPAAPTNFTATDGVYTTFIRLHWDPIPFVSQYRIYRSNSGADGDYSLLASVPAPNNIFDDNIPSGERSIIYHYRISAVNQAGDGPLSAPESGILLLAPTNFRGSTGTYFDRIRLTWNQAIGATSYRISRLRGGEEVLGEVTDLSFDDFGARADGASELYFVRSIHATNVSAHNATVGNRAAEGPPRIVSQPVNQVALLGSAATFTIDAWSPMGGGGEILYQWQRNGVNIVGANGATYTTPPARIEDDLVRYRCIVSNDFGTITSGEASLRVLHPPQNVQATDGQGHLWVTWELPGYWSSFNIYRSETPGAACTSLLAEEWQPTADPWSYRDTTTTAGLSYFYSVRAVAPNGQLSACSSVDGGYRGIQAPLSFAASDGTSTVGVNLSWTARSEAVSYNILRSNDQSCAGAAVVLSGVPGTSAVDTSATPGVTYCYQITSRGPNGLPGIPSAGESGYRALLPPTNIAATDGDRDVVITWAAAAGAASYRVYRSTSSNPIYACTGNPIVSGLNNTTFTDANSERGFVGYYSVQSVGPNGQATAASCSNLDAGYRGLTISGRVRLDAPPPNGLGGVTITLSPSDRSSVSDSSGNFVIGRLLNGSYTATASRAGYSFNPPSQSRIQISGQDVTIADFIAAADPSSSSANTSSSSVSTSSSSSSSSISSALSSSVTNSTSSVMNSSSLSSAISSSSLSASSVSSSSQLSSLSTTSSAQSSSAQSVSSAGPPASASSSSVASSERSGDSCALNMGVDCIDEQIAPAACAGANGFLGQVNIATVINRLTITLQARVSYRDLAGVVRGELLALIEPNSKQDFIVNNFGLERDSYGLVCVETDATIRGAWSGSVTVYKPNTRSGNFPFGTSFDFALDYPFTNPRIGTSTVPLNTFHLGIPALNTVANWISISDADFADGEGLTGELIYFDEQGQVFDREPVNIPNGGRQDYAGHRIGGRDGGDAVGMARFEPGAKISGANAEYYLTLARYYYDSASALGDNFYTALNIPDRPATDVSLIGDVSTVEGVISIIELNNTTASPVRGNVRVYDRAGAALGGVTGVSVPPLGTRHVILNRAGDSGFLVDNTIGSARIDGTESPMRALSFFYKLTPSGVLEYAFSAPLQGASPNVAQISQFNSFIAHENEVVVTNVSDTPMRLSVDTLDFLGRHVFGTTLTLPVGGTDRLFMTLPEDRYGTVLIQGERAGFVSRVYTSRPGEYTLVNRGQ